MTKRHTAAPCNPLRSIPAPWRASMGDPKEPSRCCPTLPRWLSKLSWTGSSSRAISATATSMGRSNTLPCWTPSCERHRQAAGAARPSAAESQGFGRVRPARLRDPGEVAGAGIERAPDYIGADMGSIDPGPYYLGSGELATAPATTRADLTRLLRAAQARHSAADRHRRL